MESTNHCYVCGLEATSSEHVPARCFFPEEASYRKQLITVPSCPRHNEDTSLDDEYVRNIICSEYSGNHLAFTQFKRKAVKSLSRNPMMLFPYRKITTPKGESGAFTIDRARFDKALRKIAYALYFDAYKEPWNKRLMIFSRQLLYQDFTQDAAINLISEFESKLPEAKRQGENPQVFQSSILKTGKLDENSLVKMIFYEGFTIWAMVEIGSVDFTM